jgi:hypothetical protein
MKNLAKLVFVVFFFLFASTQPSFALFNNECKKPKSTYQNYLNEYTKQLSAERAAASKFESQRNRDFQQCLTNPRVFLVSRNLNAVRKDKIGCEYWKAFYAGSPTIFGRSSITAYKDAMLIVKSYQKCFDPSVYINALKWLEMQGK